MTKEEIELIKKLKDFYGDKVYISEEDGGFVFICGDDPINNTFYSIDSKFKRYDVYLRLWRDMVERREKKLRQKKIKQRISNARNGRKR